MYNAIKNPHKLFYIGKKALSPPIDAFPPFNSIPPSVAPETGEVYTSVYCFNGEWTYANYFFYQWYRNGEAIFGATELYYQAKNEDQNKTLTCRVTGVNNIGSVSVLSYNSCYIGVIEEGITTGLLLEDGSYFVLLEDSTSVLMLE